MAGGILTYLAVGLFMFVLTLRWFEDLWRDTSTKPLTLKRRAGFFMWCLLFWPVIFWRAT